MDWNKLKSFYIISQIGNISRAAEKMNLNQSSLSRQILALEKQLQSKLFIRDLKGLKLTTEGKILFDAVQKVDRELNIAKKLILGHDRSLRGEFKVLSTAGFAASYLASYVPEFLKKYPEMNFSLIANDDLNSFDIREMDIVIHPKIASDPELIQEHLFTTELRLFASPQYLKEYGNPKKISDLESHKLIAYGDYRTHPFPNLNWHLIAGLPSKQTRTASTTINFASGRICVAEEGLGILSIPHNHPQLKKKNLVEVLPEIQGPTIEIFLIYEKARQNSKKIQAFCSYMRDIFAS